MKESTAARKIGSVRHHSTGSQRQVDRTNIVRIPPDRDVRLIGEDQLEAVIRGPARTDIEEVTFHWRDGHPWHFARTDAKSSFATIAITHSVRCDYIA